MNAALAKIHFPEGIEDPEELYAEKLFRIKQFYFQRNPIPKVCQQKVKELRDMHAAFLLRFPNSEMSNAFSAVEVSHFSQDLISDFSILQNAQVNFRLRIASCHNALDLAHYLESWYDVEYRFAATYSSIFAHDDLSEVNLAQSKDPMLLNQSLTEIDRKNHLITDIEFDTSKLPLVLLEEFKRCAKFIELHRGII